MSHDPLKHPLVGCRIRLLRYAGRWDALTPGSMGTVRAVDCMDTVHVDWDCGVQGGLCAEAGDDYEVVLDEGDVEPLTLRSRPDVGASSSRPWSWTAVDDGVQLAYSSSML